LVKINYFLKFFGTSKRVIGSTFQKLQYNRLKFYLEPKALLEIL